MKIYKIVIDLLIDDGEGEFYLPDVIWKHIYAYNDTDAEMFMHKMLLEGGWWLDQQMGYKNPRVEELTTYQVISGLDKSVRVPNG